MSPALRPASRLPLAELQRWFLGEVTGDPAIGGPSSPVEDQVLPSATLAAGQRLAIYREMYFARLHEALADDFPGVASLLGEPDFSTLIADYLRAHPPHSFTLAHVGRELPEFLSGHPEHGGAATRDVAAVEWAIAAAFDAESDPPVGADALAEVSADEWFEARLRPTGGFAVLPAAVDVHSVLDAIIAGTPVRPPAARRAWSLVWRKGFTVWRRSIDEAAFVTLRELAAGQPIAAALEAAIDAFPDDPASLESRVAEWFSQWLDDGLFAAIVLPTREIRSNP